MSMRRRPQPPSLVLLLIALLSYSVHVKAGTKVSGYGSEKTQFKVATNKDLKQNRPSSTRKLLCTKLSRNGNNKVLLLQDSFNNTIKFSSSNSNNLMIDRYDKSKTKSNEKVDECMPVEGIYGVYELPSGLMLALIVSSEEVYTSPLPATTNGQNPKPLIRIRKVRRIELVPVPTREDGKVMSNPRLPSHLPDADAMVTRVVDMVTSREEARQVLVLKNSLKEHDLYFTPPSRLLGEDDNVLYDAATNCLQNYLVAAAAAPNSTVLSPDSRFFWNEEIVRPIQQSVVAPEWTLPCSSAFLGISRSIPFQKSDNAKASKKGKGLFHMLFSKMSADSSDDCKNSEGLVYDQLLISRRSRFRAGTRFTRRGADSKGSVANYAETEQIIFVKQRVKDEVQLSNSTDTLDSGENAYSGDFQLLDVHSLVQTRGSIPLLWSSPAHVTTYRPKVHIETDPLSQARALRAHVFEQLKIYSGYDYFSSPPRIVDDIWKNVLPCDASAKKNYGSPTSLLTIINLIDKHGDQGKLGRSLDSVLQAVLDIHSVAGAKTENVPNLKETVNHVWFDFHAECRKEKGGWDNLKALLNQIESDMDAQGYLSAVPSDIDNSFHILRYQKGVLRTNCMDCLDRTNVVQSIIARRGLFRQLQQRSSQGKHRSMSLGYVVAFTKKDPLHLPWIEGEVAHRLLWADNADAISNLYAGTNALKRDYTRTGQRTKKGAVDDGVNSLTRHYVNNFIDANRQEGVDLMTGVQQFSNVNNAQEAESNVKDQMTDENSASPTTNSMHHDFDEESSSESNTESDDAPTLSVHTVYTNK